MNKYYKSTACMTYMELGGDGALGFKLNHSLFPLCNCAKFPPAGTTPGWLEKTWHQPGIPGWQPDKQIYHTYTVLLRYTYTTYLCNLW